MYPGVKHFPRHFDAVVVYHNEANEVNFLKDVLQRYQDAPIKAFHGKENYHDIGQYHAQAFKHGEHENLVNAIKTSYQNLEEIIKKAFSAFDKDNSGHIDASELKAVSKELLGRELDAAELEECL